MKMIKGGSWGQAENMFNIVLLMTSQLTFIYNTPLY